MRRNLLSKLVVTVLWVVAAHSILATMNWAPPGYSIRTAQFISLAYLVLGLICLLFNRFRVMIICLGCSAAISFLVHEMTIAPRKTYPQKKNWNQTDSIQRQPPPLRSIPDL